MKLNGTRIDNLKVSEGEWTRFVLQTADTSYPIELRLRCMDAQLNKGYGQAIRRAMRPFKKELAAYQENLDAMPAEITEKINAASLGVIAAEIVADWKNVHSDDACTQEVPYSPEAMLTLLSEYPELVEAITKQASDLARYRVSSLKDAAGNS